MSTVQIIAAAVGFLIIAITVWKIGRHGFAKSNGKRPEPDTSWGAGGD